MSDYYAAIHILFFKFKFTENEFTLRYFDFSIDFVCDFLHEVRKSLDQNTVITR
jgi:hypothetical protein